MHTKICISMQNLVFQIEKSLTCKKLTLPRYAFIYILYMYMYTKKNEF